MNCVQIVYWSRKSRLYFVKKGSVGISGEIQTKQKLSTWKAVSKQQNSNTVCLWRHSPQENCSKINQGKSDGGSGDGGQASTLMDLLAPTSYMLTNGATNYAFTDDFGSCNQSGGNGLTTQLNVVSGWRG